MSVHEVALHRLARALTERFGLDERKLGPIEAVYSDSTLPWTLVWTDGPTVEQLRRAEPDAAASLRYVRNLTEDSIALGAIRLAIGNAARLKGRSHISTAAVHDFWSSVPLPVPATDRERRLVYGAIYQVRDNHHANFADHQEICDEVAAGLAPLAKRTGAALNPLEALTAQYAVGRDRAAWHFGLTPMPSADAFQAVCDDPRASPEAIAAALTLQPDLPATTTAAAARLQARHSCPEPVSLDAVHEEAEEGFRIE
jgi:hypothetical protein